MDIVVVWWDITCMTTNQKNIYIYILTYIDCIDIYTYIYRRTNPYWESHPSSIDKQASKRGSVMVAFVGLKSHHIEIVSPQPT